MITIHIHTDEEGVIVNNVSIDDDTTPRPPGLAKDTSKVTGSRSLPTPLSFEEETRSDKAKRRLPTPPGYRPETAKKNERTGGLPTPFDFGQESGGSVGTSLPTPTESEGDAPAW